MGLTDRPSSNAGTDQPSTHVIRDQQDQPGQELRLRYLSPRTGEDDSISEPPQLLSLPPATKPKKPLSFHLSILMLAIVALVVSWDSTTLAVATPTITNILHGSTLESFWASIAFMLGVVVTQPIYATVSNIFGRKAPLLIATLLFAAGSIVFALANNMIVVIMGRLLQGLGGGGLDVLQAIILSDITTLKERPLYLGIMGLAIAIGTVTGPFVGALFTEYVEWRWIGWINLPFAGVAFLLAWFCLRLRRIDLSFRSKLRRLDALGMLLFATGTSLLALSLSWADALFPWASWQTLLPLIAGFAVLAVFTVYEKRPSEPLVPHRMFSNRTFGAALASGLLNGMVMYSLILYLPLFFQAVFQQPPLQAALMGLPLACVTLGFSFLASIVMQHSRRYRLQLRIGWVLTAVFLGMWSLVGKDSSAAMNNTIQVFLGAGIGIVFTTTTVQIQASVELVDDMGLGAGLLVIFRLFGALLGQAIGAAVFSSTFQERMAEFGPLPESLKPLESPSRAIGFIHNLRTLELSDNVRDRLVSAYESLFQRIWIVMAGFACAGVLASFLSAELSMEREDVGRQGFELS